MNAVPAALNTPAPASSPKTAATGSTRATGGKPASSSDASFDEVMGDALDSQSKQASDTSTQTGTAQPSADDAVPTPSTDDNSEEKSPTEESSPLAVTTVPSQVMLALAGAVATPAPVAAAPEPVATTAPQTDTASAAGESSASPGSTGTALVPEVLATEQAGSSSQASAATTPTLAATAQTAAGQQAAAIATVAQAAPVAAETAAAEAEKKTGVAGSGRTKLPMTTTSAADASSKTQATQADADAELASQPSAVQSDASLSPVLEQLSATTDTVRTATAGTDRAPEQPMQTLRDVWSNSAFRALAFGGDTFAAGTLANPSSVSTEKVSVSSSGQFAEAVQNALNTPRELLPRRVEIQMQTPPGATVTLSLTRTNGELRAQFDANNAQTLQWLNGEIGRLQNMNFGLTVRWAPPQLASQQEEMSQRPAQDRQEERRREGGKRRNQQPSMDALTGVSPGRVTATAQKG